MLTILHIYFGGFQPKGQVPGQVEVIRKKWFQGFHFFWGQKITSMKSSDRFTGRDTLEIMCDPLNVSLTAAIQKQVDVWEFSHFYSSCAFLSHKHAETFLIVWTQTSKLLSAQCHKLKIIQNRYF